MIIPTTMLELSPSISTGCDANGNEVFINCPLCNAQNSQIVSDNIAPLLSFVTASASGNFRGWSGYALRSLEKYAGNDNWVT